MRPPTLALCLFGLLCVTSTALAQSEWEFLSNASKQIRDRNPEVTIKLIEADITVIRAALPAIRSQMSEKQFGEMEIKNATASGWNRGRNDESGRRGKIDACPKNQCAVRP